MKGKGLFIACGVVCVMALACLIGGDYSAFGGALIVAAILLAVALLKRRRAPQTPGQAPVAAPHETAAAEPVPAAPSPAAVAHDLDGPVLAPGTCRSTAPTVRIFALTGPCSKISRSAAMTPPPDPLKSSEPAGKAMKPRWTPALVKISSGAGCPANTFTSWPSPVGILQTPFMRPAPMLCGTLTGAVCTTRIRTAAACGNGIPAAPRWRWRNTRACAHVKPVAINNPQRWPHGRRFFHALAPVSCSIRFPISRCRVSYARASASALTSSFPIM